MPTPSARPSSPSDILLAVNLGERQYHERLARANAGDEISLRRPPTDDEIVYVTHRLVQELRAAATLEAVQEAWTMARERVYCAFMALGPTPAANPDEIIPDGLAGYRPAEIVRILHRMEAELRRLEEGSETAQDLADELEAITMQSDIPVEDVFTPSAEMEEAIESANERPEVKAERETSLARITVGTMAGVVDVNRAQQHDTAAPRAKTILPGPWRAPKKRGPRQ